MNKLALMLILVSLLFLILLGLCLYLFWYVSNERRKHLEGLIKRQNESEAQIRDEIASALHSEAGRPIKAINYTILPKLESHTDISIRELARNLRLQLDKINTAIEVFEKMFPPIGILTFEEIITSKIHEIKTAFAYTGTVHCQINHEIDTFTNKFIDAPTKRDLITHRFYFLYCIIELFVSNSIEHSTAQHIEVLLTKEKESGILSLLLSDNGKGFNIKAKQKANQSKGIFDIESKAKALSPEKFSFESNTGTRLSLIFNLLKNIE